MDLIFKPAATPTGFEGLGKAAQVAYHPQAPTDEVEDAGSFLMKAFGGYQIPQQMDLYQIVQQTMRLKKAESAGNGMLMKAIAMMHPDAARQKARTEPWTYKVGGGGKWIPKPGIPAPVLRQLSKRLEVAKAIHRTRVRQVLRFAKKSEKPDEPGFQLYHLDPNATIDEKQNDFLDWLSKFLLHGGREFDPFLGRLLELESLPVFLQKAMQDTLTFDLVAVETVPLIEGVKGIDSFYVRDGATFHLATKMARRRMEAEDPFAYQVAYGTDEVPFTMRELSIWQRNVDSDLNSGGYAISELEDSVDTLSNWITAMAYTREGLDNNAIPRGILSIFGQFDRNTKQLFQQAWDAKVRGVANAHNLPVLFGQQGQTGEVKFVPTGQPFNEMAFAKWISLQVSLMSAIYGIDPEQIHVEGFSNSSKSGLNGDNTQEKLNEARDTGLAPLMHSLANFKRLSLLAPFAPWAGLRWTGIIDEEAAKRQEEKRRMSTINEIRKELGMDPHPLGWFGELPADPKMMDAEFQRLNATATFDEARKAWGGLKVFPSELVGMTPLNPSLGAMWNMAATAAGQEAGGGEDDGTDPGQNPFEAMNPAQGQEDAQEGQDGSDSGDDQGEAPEGQEGGPAAQPEPSELQSQTADRLKQV